MIFSLGLRRKLLKIIKSHWLISLKDKIHKFSSEQNFFLSILLKIIKPHWLISLKDKFHKFSSDQIFFSKHTTQDYQTPLADIFKRQISQILKWPKFFIQAPNTHFFFAPNIKWLLREQISKFSKIFKSSNLGFFPFLAYSQHMWFPRVLTFHFFDCL